MITDKPIRIEDYAIEDGGHASGAVVTFEGIVRANNEGRRVTSIHYDCYREMAAREIARIVDDVASTPEVGTVRAVHRIGELHPGDLALLVVVAAAHRGVAFAAAQRTIDEIKQRVPIWKKEHYADASARWL